eukprot:6178916-Pleurochrysis_carterae.AAC.1
MSRARALFQFVLLSAPVSRASPPANAATLPLCVLTWAATMGSVVQTCLAYTNGPDAISTSTNDEVQVSCTVRPVPDTMNVGYLRGVQLRVLSGHEACARGHLASGVINRPDLQKLLLDDIAECEGASVLTGAGVSSYEQLPGTCLGTFGYLGLVLSLTRALYLCVLVLSLSLDVHSAAPLLNHALYLSSNFALPSTYALTLRL